MRVRILACIQAAVLALSSFQTTASTISTENPVLVTEAETESKTETEGEALSETESYYDTIETESGEVGIESEDELLSETEDVIETKSEDVTETEGATETKSEDVTETEDITETETEDITETKPEDVTETEDVTEPEDVMETEPGTKAGDYIDTARYLTTVDAVGGKLRESLKNREAEITVYYQTTEEPDGEIAKEIWNAALEHTGKPTAGTTYYLPITYKVTYYTTNGQESELDSEVEKVIDGFGFNEDTSDYQKIKTIYDYICANYDNGNLDDADDLLKNTAYAALINKTAVCQGYASLLYRLLLECGIDARIISGTANGENHVWNIVKYGDSYYYLDAACDAEKTGNSCFLNGSDNFSGHTAEAAYTSEEFTTEYPISKANAIVDDANNGSEDSEESKDETETESSTESEFGTEPVTDTKTESEPTSADEQERDERPSITASGVLFPGKKADGYSAVYTGEKICPAMTVKYTYEDSNGKSKTQTLKLNVDYTGTNITRNGYERIYDCTKEHQQSYTFIGR